VQEALPVTLRGATSLAQRIVQVDPPEQLSEQAALQVTLQVALSPHETLPLCPTDT
jgi:hypothetical protein